MSLPLTYIGKKFPWAPDEPTTENGQLEVVYLVIKKRELIGQFTEIERTLSRHYSFRHEPKPFIGDTKHDRGQIHDVLG